VFLVVGVLLVLVLGAPTAEAAVDPAMVKTRQRFFGAANVDPRTGAVRSDKVILSWVSVTNFAAAVAGHVVLLDAWVARGYHSGYVPTSPAELAQLRPALIFIGHGHFDHAQHAHEIAAASGAAIVGTPRHCGDIRARAPGAPIRCVEASPQNASPGSRRELFLLGGVGITGLRQVHSPAPQRGATDTDERRTSCQPPPNFDATLDYPPLPGDVIENLQGAAELATSEGGVMAYQFRVGSLSVTWPDSTPNVKDSPPVATALRRLPPTDLLLGALASFGRGTYCLRDVGRYVTEVAPRLFVPTHHDNWDPTESNGSYYEPFLRDELRHVRADRRPCLRFIADPADYVRPAALTFDVRDADLCAPGVQSRARARGRVRLRLRLRYRVGRTHTGRRCARSRVRATVVGRDRRRVRRAVFYLGRRRVGADSRYPFSRIVDGRHHGSSHRHRVAARVRLRDERRARLRNRYRACARG
jgi:hypothetical protein